MLLHRIITILIAAPIAIYLVLFLTPMHFMWLTILIALWLTWEWSYLIGLQQLWSRLLFLAALMLACVATYFIPIYFILGLSVCFWFLMVIYIKLYPQYTSQWSSHIWQRVLMAFIAIPSAWLALNLMRGFMHGNFVVLYFFCLVWATDIGGYISGRLWGKHKLAPNVSPNKTIEGVIGGILLALLVAILFSWFYHMGTRAWLLIALAGVTSLSAVAGDLFISMQKRVRGIKDIGRLLPGHGGLLDRIDGLVTAAPFFALAAILLG
ncbi:MAG: phosphatidate cytidylyltransferase [Gammaproteobacteria bacterium]